MKRQLPLRRFWVYWFAFVLLIAGCSEPGTQRGSFVRIDVPVDSLSIPAGETINIEGQATDPEGVDYVEIWINNELTWTVEDLSVSEDFVRFSQPWTPEEAGDYILRAVSHGEGGQVTRSAMVTIHVGGPPDDELITEEPATEEPSSAAPSVEFWAEPEGIEAGECSMLYWQVDNAQRVVLGSTEVTAYNHLEACPCQNTSYRLTVTDLNGVDEEFWVLILVNGVCGTPPPEIDVTRPPVPLQLQPLDGAVVGPPQTWLRWEAVTDQSGIREYRVEAERHDGDFVWEQVPGSMFYAITVPELLLNVESGYTYRWRVRAIDGADIRSNWSVWFTFSVP
jgi:hypothetical protein